ncbi:FAD/NAD(P)-binding domain-containing protein [Lepidopterella palustris CBS 459.81]|uniref:FAD/NAD(P)-binding domain-containing protein n=1 Tax=Lepidopterella palustris CBS 459.81 TaxID=1314670 RepID=A0A8E2JAL7_9PEZI|nr:FAD/NAD(P)-binding domain-containing protein [Lepidopterella palustris CBS 459.81]
MQRDIGESGGHDGINGAANGVNGSTPDSSGIIQLDVLVVGAGFAGCYLLYQLRRRNFNVKVVEAGTGLGGVWHWSTYPGARVDTTYPIYAYSLPEVYTTWTWTEKFPSSAELRAYFEHVDKQLQLKKDVILNTKVTAAEFNNDTNKWSIHCNDGKIFQASFFVPALGFAAKRYFPDWEGLNTFKGVMHHSSFWPEEGVDVRNKRIGVVGTGATGIQLAQECAKEAGELTLFQRTPNMCCPMVQRPLTVEEQEQDKANYPEIFKERLTHDAGFLHSSRRNLLTFSHTPEQRDAFYEELWRGGGFLFAGNSYGDMMTDDAANLEAYKFWRKKVRARIHDPETADILAPEIPPHAFAGKRVSLEQDFYEQFNKPNIHVVDMKRNPVKRVVENGIITADGKLHELDVIALATGFDAVTGGLKDIQIRGLDGELLADKWSKGTWTYLGMATAGYPNLLFTYGPQAPGALSNGPSSIEPQSDWIVKVLEYMRDNSLKKIDVLKEAEDSWRELVNAQSARVLKHNIDSWWMGANIPGKPREALNYGGGLPLYIKTINDVFNNGLEGFKVQ